MRYVSSKLEEFEINLKSSFNSMPCSFKLFFASCLKNSWSLNKVARIKIKRLAMRILESQIPNFLLPSLFGIQYERYISPNNNETVNNIAKSQDITNEFIYCRCRFLLCHITVEAKRWRAVLKTSLIPASTIINKCTIFLLTTMRPIAFSLC
jgi:hypothetical protein